MGYIDEKRKCDCCSNQAEYVEYWKYGEKDGYGYYCKDCAVNNFGGFDKVDMPKTCDWCGKDLPDKFYSDRGGCCYCSIECALLDCGLEKITKEVEK